MTQFGGGGSPADTELPTAEEPGDGDPNVASPAVTARMQAWYGAVWTRVPLYGGPTLADDLGFGVHISSSTIITTRPETTLTAQPASNADATYIRLVGMGQQSTADSLSIVPGTDYNATSIPLANARSMVVRLPRTGRVTEAESQSFVLAAGHEGLEAALPWAVEQSDGLNLYPGASEQTLAEIAAIMRHRPTIAVHAFVVGPADQKSMLSVALDPLAGFNLSLRDIVIVNTVSTAGNGLIIDFRLCRFATHSAGTLLTVGPSLDSQDTIPIEITARTGATITGEITTPLVPPWRVSSDEYATGPTEIESYQVAFAGVFGGLRLYDPQAKKPIIRPGEGVHLRCNTNTTYGEFQLSFMFTIEPP